MKLSRNSLRLLAGGLVIGTLAVSSCGGAADSNDEALAADSTDTADQVSALTSIMSDGADLSMAGLTSQSAAQGAMTGASAKLSASCLTAMTSGNVVTYTLKNCTGPYGLISLSGTLTATYTVQSAGAAPSLKVDLSGTGLKVNGASLSVNSSAIITGPANSRTAVVTSNTSATSARNNSITHSGNYTAGWDGACVSLTGSFSTRSGLLAFGTEIDSYRRCQDRCPAQGSITFTGRHVATLTFNGTATAQITVDGRAGRLPLLCQL